MYDMQFDVRALAAQAEIKTYDTALPQRWVDDVHEKTGYWPQSYGFVWNYDNAGFWGEPFPLTAAAQILLAFYNHLCKDARG